LGQIQKKDTRKIASELKLNVAHKPDSQDICFVPNGNYASVIEKFRPKSFQEGNIVDVKGKVIGKHNGIINFTIGQRKGIKIAHKEPLYVVSINASENKVIVGNKEALFINKIYLRDVNLLGDLKRYGDNLFIKVRSTGRLIKAKVNLKGKEFEVILNEDEAGISPGQACVFYYKNDIGDKVLGGGWITNTVSKYLST
jgi:tRNA-specific 2-thiouridylase